MAFCASGPWCWFYWLCCWCFWRWLSGDQILTNCMTWMNSMNQYGGEIHSMNDYTAIKSVSNEVIRCLVDLVGWLDWIGSAVILARMMMMMMILMMMMLMVMIMLWEMHLFNAISAIFKSALFASAGAKIEQNWSPPPSSSFSFNWQCFAYFFPKLAILKIIFLLCFTTNSMKNSVRSSSIMLSQVHDIQYISKR